MSRIRVIERGFLRGKTVFQKPVRWIHMSEVRGLGAKHALAIAVGELDMVELEFPDCPLHDRFFRIGTNPDGMKLPVGLDLEKL